LLVKEEAGGKEVSWEAIEHLGEENGYLRRDSSWGN
jgi:hypothetical protein